MYHGAVSRFLYILREDDRFWWSPSVALPNNPSTQKKKVKQKAWLDPMKIGNGKKYLDKEKKMRKAFLWALGTSTVHGIIATKYVEKSTKWIYCNYLAFLQLALHRHRIDLPYLWRFFWVIKQQNGISEQHWEKSCKLDNYWILENKTNAELVVSKSITFFIIRKLRDRFHYKRLWR